MFVARIALKPCGRTLTTEGNVTDVVFDLSVLPDSVCNPFLCNFILQSVFRSGGCQVSFRAV